MKAIYGIITKDKCWRFYVLALWYKTERLGKYICTLKIRNPQCAVAVWGLKRIAVNIQDLLDQS